jgi:signal transduction histidine kinase
MGIGLSVSRSIIEHHRGRLWATANEGPGATFAFSIPRERENVAEVHRPAPIPTSAVMDAERTP